MTNGPQVIADESFKKKSFMTYVKSLMIVL